MGGEAVHFGFSGHEIKGIADHFGGFQAWIPERSDFFNGPKGPEGPLSLGKTQEGGQSQKKKVEKPQNWRQAKT